MLRYAGPRIKAAGKLAIANIGEWVDHPALAHSWLRDLDGGMDEKFVKWSADPGVGYREPHQWLSQEREVLTTEKMGKRFLAVTAAAPVDAHAALYGWRACCWSPTGTPPIWQRRPTRVRTLAGGVPNPPRTAAGGDDRRPGRHLSPRVLRGPRRGQPDRGGGTGLAGRSFDGPGLTHVRATTLAAHGALVLVGAPAPVATHWWWTAIVGAGLLALLLLLALWRRRRAGPVRTAS